MSLFHFRRPAITSIVILFLISFWSIYKSTGGISPYTGEISLQTPPFLRVAKAESNQSFNFADDEAGIAGYINVSQTVDLSKVDDLCRNISEQNANYLICSIDVPDYDENHSPTVYIHKDGWVMAYYRNTEPVSKLIDFRHYTGDANLPTKFEQVINLVTSKIGAASTKPTYYHFAYPNANKMLLIAEKAPRNTVDSFRVNLPTTFSYFEKSWSLVSDLDCCSKVKFLLNDQEIAEISSNQTTWVFAHGTLTSNQMNTGDFTISLVTDFRPQDGFAGLGLVYKSS